MSELTAEQVVVLSKLLGARERTLVDVIDEHIAALRASRTPEKTSQASDIADRAKIELVRQRQLAAVDHDLKAFGEIKAAREHLAAGSINRCIDCAEEISFDRLLACPTASRCVPCQDLHEQIHRLVPDMES